MKCPKCEVIELTMADRSGVEIDYCSACRGVWLDRGELDKIIERNSAEIKPVSQTSRPAGDSREAFSSRPDYGSSQREYRGDDGYRHNDYRKGKRKSFLSELFD